MILKSVAVEKNSSLYVSEYPGNFSVSLTILRRPLPRVLYISTTSDDKLPESKEGNHTLEILFATLSSLLLVVAIIIALVFTRLSGKRKKTHGKKNKVQVSDANDQKGFV